MADTSDHRFGGRETSLLEKAKAEASSLSSSASSLADKAKGELKVAEGKAKDLVGKVTGS